MEHTRVSFVLGQHQEAASVLYCERGDPTLLVTDLTPFHPQSHLWPDQPGDAAALDGERDRAIRHHAAVGLGDVAHLDDRRRAHLRKTTGDAGLSASP